MRDELEESHRFKVHGRNTTAGSPTRKKALADGFAPPEYLLLYFILAKRRYHRYCILKIYSYNILWFLDNAPYDTGEKKVAGPRRA